LNILKAVSAIVAGFTSVCFAGPLSPPLGPVSPTYKTLTEVEPRISISSANTPGDSDATPSTFKIAQPGSYYLAGNLTGQTGRIGIEIDADGVTLDLNGFSLTGVAGSLDGVRVTPGRRGITVRNGTLRAWGGAGLSAVGGPNADACTYEHLRAVGNGVDSDSVALDIGGASTISHCVAAFNLGTGIRGNNGSIISHCASSGNGGDGIINGAGTVDHCLARGNAIDGIRVGGGSVVSNCSATANASAGITLSGGSSAQGNASFSNFWGIYVFGDGCSVEDNTMYSNSTGIEVESEGNFIVRNKLRANTIRDVIAPGNDVGPFQSAATSTSPWANLGL
jgi:parallel beta-helix repeat protein